MFYMFSKFMFYTTLKPYWLILWISKPS